MLYRYPSAKKEILEAANKAGMIVSQDGDALVLDGLYARHILRPGDSLEVTSEKLRVIHA